MTALDGVQAAAVAFLEVSLWAVMTAAFDRLAPRAWVHSRYSLALAGIWLLPLALCLSLRPTPAPLFAESAPTVRTTAPAAVVATENAGPAPIYPVDSWDTGRSEVTRLGIPFLLLAWACVSLVLGLRLAGDLLLLRSVWRRRSSEALPIELSLPLAVHRCVEVRAPVFMGYGYQMIAVPRSFTIDDDARLVLEHEVAHAVRRDDASELMTRIVLVFFWWALPAYVLDRIVRRNREILCDQRAADVTGRPHQLAQALVREAERCVQTPRLTLAIHPSKAMLSARVDHLIDASRGLRRSKGPPMKMHFVLPILGAAVFAGTPQVVAQSGSSLLQANLRPEPEEIRAVDQALFEAAEEGDLERIESLLAKGADADAVISGDGSPLIAAARHGHAAAVERLLDAGADPNLGVPGDGTPLINASAHGREDVIRQLVRGGASVDAGIRQDGNPLISAALRGRVETAELLLSLGANPNAYVYGDETPLINAAQAGHVPVAEVLVRAGAELSLTVKTPDRTGPDTYRSPLSEAQRMGHKEMVKWLSNRGAVHRPEP
ncbi:MAG: ankyrin repeat domain-containing protein [Myxococcota bacterium]